jgi:hypothetical protein
VGDTVGRAEGCALGRCEWEGMALGETLYVGAGDTLGASDGRCDFLLFPLPLPSLI